MHERESAAMTPAESHDCNPDARASFAAAPGSACAHKWIGDTCVECGIVWHIWAQREVDRLSQALRLIEGETWSHIQPGLKTTAGRLMAVLIAVHRIADGTLTPND